MSLQIIISIALACILLLFLLGVWMTVTSLNLLRENKKLVMEKEKLSEVITEKNRFLDRNNIEIKAIKTHVTKMKDDVKQKEKRIAELLKQT